MRRAWRRVGSVMLAGVAVAGTGCSGLVHLTRRPIGQTLAAVEHGTLRKTVSGIDQEESLSVLEESGALGRLERRGMAGWARLVLTLDSRSGSTLGESSGALEDRYRLRAGTYVVTLRGVAVGTASMDWSVAPMLAVTVRLFREGVADPIIERQWQVESRLTPLTDGGALVWLTTAGSPALTCEIPAAGVYRVASSFRIATETHAAAGSLSLDGAFSASMATAEERAKRSAQAEALRRQLVALWTQASPYGGDRTELEQAAAAMAEGFFTEGLDYVEAMIEPEKRRVCMEHARLVHEWFSRRAAQDPRLGRWFRMTRIRRQIPLFWQSSNLVTPNLDEPPSRWLRDGTGIVLEPKATAADGLVGRALSAAQFSLWRGLVEAYEGDEMETVASVRSPEGGVDAAHP